jgi:small subunit ribosomal protein S1
VRADSAPRPIDQLWEAARRVCDHDEILEVAVTGYNRGGLLIDWGGLHGFVPASHILNMPNVTDDAQRRSEFEKRVGHSAKGKVIELDRAHGRFVLSERLAYNDRTRVEMLMADLQPGQRRCGVVTTVCDFGAFIDLGGIEGLAHISEISWGRINHPADLLRSGQNVEVHVMLVDRDQRRVALSLKRLCPDPWVTVPERYQLNQMVEGTVTTVVDFGAFVRLEDGVEGLIHISELAEGSFLHPRNVVHENDVVRVRVLNVDVSHRRLGLSLRQARPAQSGVAPGEPSAPLSAVSE